MSPSSRPTFVNISKLSSLGGILTPLTSHLLTSPIPILLSDLRVNLVTAGIITSPSQLFLNSAGFPIALSDEASISWLDLTDKGTKPLGIYFPHAPESPAPKANAPTIDQPKLPDGHHFDPLTVPSDLPIPPVQAVLPVGAGSGSPSNARLLSEAQLGEVFDINSLCSGYLLSGGADACNCSDIFSVPSSLKQFVRVADKATIDTITTFAASSAALARQGFDTASLSLGTPWAAGSTAAARSRGTGIVTKDSHAYITGVYRFARARVNFQPRDLHPRAEFLADLATALQGDDDDTKRLQLRQFFSQYGHAFAFTVELGGLLYTTKEDVVSSESEQHQKENDIRGALSLSIQTGSLPAISGGVGAERSTSVTNSGQMANNRDAIFFEATGGDTLLASDPPNWTKTVSDFQNWRICKLSNMILITDIPGLFTPAQQAEIKRLTPGALLQQQTAKIPRELKPLQGRWVPARAVQDGQGFASFERLVMYMPDPNSYDSRDGWFSIGQTMSPTSALIVRQNPAWRPISDCSPSLTPTTLPSSISPPNTVYSSLGKASLDPSDPDAPFCPIIKYDQLWSASTFFDPKARNPSHMFSLWEPFPLDPGRFASLSSAFSSHAPVEMPPAIDPNIVCINKKFLVPAELGNVKWTEKGAFVSHEAACISIVPHRDQAISVSDHSKQLGGVGIAAGTWKAVVGRTSEEFQGELWLVDDDFIEFMA